MIFLLICNREKTEFSPLCMVMFCLLETEKLLSEKVQESSVAQ